MTMNEELLPHSGLQPYNLKEPLQLIDQNSDARSILWLGVNTKMER